MTMTDQDLRELLAKATEPMPHNPDADPFEVRSDRQDWGHRISDARTAIVAALPDLLARLAAQDRVIAEMGEALEPFATFDVPLHEDNDWVVAQSIYSSASITAGMIRCARAALAGRDGRE